MNVETCNSLEQVRHAIDRIDLQMLALLAERGGYVQQAARFKRTAADVPAPPRVEAVVAGIANHARAIGADPAVAEATWRAMIAAFIESELAAHANLHPPTT
ncbi:chorismate mutase [Thiobacillus sp.]|uniref:chorismate mutase n=1 Tax=Thiobacillus sp. TaxID=924 RepID=UPI001ACB4A3B|nr:chorismate mutase [Thiobacillus sp.]MBN8779904.1 chorismate mutase [Thiobacillus sp.]